MGLLYRSGLYRDRCCFLTLGNLKDRRWDAPDRTLRDRVEAQRLPRLVEREDTAGKQSRQAGRRRRLIVEDGSHSGPVHRKGLVGAVLVGQVRVEVPEDAGDHRLQGLAMERQTGLPVIGECRPLQSDVGPDEDRRDAEDRADAGLGQVVQPCQLHVLRAIAHRLILGVVVEYRDPVKVVRPAELRPPPRPNRRRLLLGGQPPLYFEQAGRHACVGEIDLREVGHVEVEVDGAGRDLERREAVDIPAGIR